MDSSGINWDEVEKNTGDRTDSIGRRRRASRNYQQSTCPLCGRVISEAAYSGRNGNFSKHVKACEKKHAK